MTTAVDLSLPARIEAASRRDRALLIGVTVLVSGFGWVWLARLGDVCCRAGLASSPWSAAEIFAVFGMWAAMTLAMMLPIVSPWALVLADVSRKMSPASSPLDLSAAFVSGYLVAWLGYSLLATLVQLALQAAAMRSAIWQSANPWFGGSLLVLAGLYQWTPLRSACMRHCRSPIGFFLTSWREGRRGAFEMGLRHGVFCIGCCWALMALCLAFGMMNLAWMAGLTAFVLLEKVGPFGPGMSRAAGALLAAWGIRLLFTASALH